MRVDRWLWAVRVFKTRAQANEACGAGRVRVNGSTAKPATKIKVGDTIEARRRERLVIVEVQQLLEKRVSATLAVAAYADHSPPPPDTRSSAPLTGDAVAGRRDRGAGRPTKRDRRKIERFKGNQ